MPKGIAEEKFDALMAVNKYNKKKEAPSKEAKFAKYLGANKDLLTKSEKNTDVVVLMNSKSKDEWAQTFDKRRAEKERLAYKE